MTDSGPFKLESEMVAALKSSLASALGLKSAGDLSFLTEVMIGNVVPDFLIGCWRGTPVRRLSTLNYIDAAIIAVFEAATELSEKDLKTRVFITPSRIASSLAKLERVGALERTPSGTIRNTGVFGAARVEITAVEVKLRRWREALQQATAYRSFADTSYVVLDAAQVDVSDGMQDQFRRAGVGLFLQRGDSLELCVPAIVEARSTSERVVATCKLAASSFSP